MDASEHEYPTMQRHGARVPTSFYTQFAKDAHRFASNHANSRLISVLEGGYSDRALSSATAALLSGLCPQTDVTWSNRELTQLERACSMNGKRPTDPIWCGQASQIFSLIEGNDLPIPAAVTTSNNSTPRQLRERKAINYEEAISTPVGRGRGRPPKPISANHAPVAVTVKIEPPTVSSAPPNVRFVWKAGSLSS